jgi:hypothetical protein
MSCLHGTLAGGMQKYRRSLVSGGVCSPLIGAARVQTAAEAAQRVRRGFAQYFVSAQKTSYLHRNYGYGPSPSYSRGLVYRVAAGQPLRRISQSPPKLSVVRTCQRPVLVSINATSTAVA